MPIDTLDALLEEELKDLYDAEKQLTKALPKMAKAATHPDLKEAYTEHLEQTKNQVTRIEQIFEMLGKKAKSKPCAAMKGLVEEAQEQIKEDAEDTIKDMMLITASQKAEHYEIAGYGSVRTLAEALGKQDIADLLQETLDEEVETDEKLTEIAHQLVAEAGGEDEDDEDEEEENEEDAEEGIDDDELEEDEEEEEEEEEKPVAKKAAKPAVAKKKK